MTIKKVVDENEEQQNNARTVYLKEIRIPCTKHQTAMVSNKKKQELKYGEFHFQDKPITSEKKTYDNFL